ncbi:MAG: DUF72 domain-containing protein [Chitinophagaceae bacterium]
MKKRGHIRIGTSNVVVPGNKQTFPPAFRQKSRLHYCSSIFNTVEINSSFYKVPLRSTYTKWTLDVPADFQFSLKLHREITHVKELKGKLDSMDQFMETASGAGKKKGCLLIQFPGKITLDYFDKVENILQQLDKLDESREWRKAVEFRHPSWFLGETWELLDEYGATMVLEDIPKARQEEQRGKAGFVYMRFHGPKGDYRDSYSDKFLQDKARQIKQWLCKGMDVYAYFNNTLGNAYANAIKLKDLLDG